MAIDTKTPMALYKANLELVMRLGALLQENRRRWTRFGVASADEAIERTLSETGRLLTTNDWTSLANLPGEAFWKAVQGEPGPMQGALDAAVGNQNAFAQGLQEAFGAWQQQCAEVIREAGGTPPVAFNLDSAWRSATTRPAAPAPARGSTAAKKATPPRKPAATKKATPARKPAAAREAKPAKKPAAAGKAARKASTTKTTARRKTAPRRGR